MVSARKRLVAELSRRFGCTLEHWYAEQAAISVAGSDMSVESLLMCCGGTGMVFPDR